MRDGLSFQLLANLVLVLHFGIVAFNLGGLVLIVAGNLAGWCWVNAWWFRITHLVTIATVVVQAWLGVTCPLTTLEMWLRANAGAGTYRGGFVEYWIDRLLFYSAPPWVFVVGYSLFGLLVLGSWLRYPPVSVRGGIAHGDDREVSRQPEP